jgi:uncharacterized membrane protein (UPF0136 family)
MTQAFPWIRGRLDRMGMLLSCLCAVHCVVGIVIVAGLGLGGSILLDPIFHRAGLLLAMIIAGVAIGVGAIRHRRAAPFVVAMTGLTFMGGGLAAETPFTLEGYLLIVDHGQGLSSAFLHSSELLVREGERVRQGQPIGRIGATGRATGPHLHWGLMWRGQRLDPLLFVGPLP